MELTENKSNIGSGALNAILSWNRTVVADQSAISRRSVGERSATDWRSVGDWLATVSWAFVFDCRKSATFWRSVGDQSATKKRVGIVCNRCNWSAISRPPVGDQSATCWRPPKTFLRSIWSQRSFTCSNQNLIATKSSLQPSANGRRPVADFLATALQPPCDHPKFWSQGGRRPVASYVWPGLYATVCSGVDQRKHQSSASLGFVRGIHRWPVNSFHNGPVTRKMFPFDDVIMIHQKMNISHCLVSAELNMFPQYITMSCGFLRSVCYTWQRYIKSRRHFLIFRISKATCKK